MSSFGAYLVAVAVGGLIGFTIAYVMVHSEVGRRAANRLFGYIAVVYAITAAMLIGLTIGFHGSTRRSVTEALLLSFMVLTWAAISWLMAGRFVEAIRGRALVTLPRLPRPWFALGAAVLLVMTSFVQWATNGSLLATLAHTEQASVAVFILLTVMIRPQLRERGVVLFGTFLPWRLLHSYAWEGESGQTLTLRRRRLITGWLLAYPRISLRIPPERQEQVDALLRQHLECTEPLRPIEERSAGDSHRALRPVDSAEKGAPSPLGRIPIPR